MIRINNLNLIYNDKYILKNINMNLKGKVGIIGSSGSGKSMITKSILKLVPEKFITQGSIDFMGEDLVKMKEKDISKIRGKDIGYVPQDPHTALDPEIKIYKQVQELYKIHKEKVNMEKFEKLIKNFGLENTEEILNKYPRKLSGGQLQRILIAISLLLNPRLIIMDEATTALDSISQYQIAQIIKSIDTDYLFISHDLKLVSKMVDYIYVINHGELVEEGKTEEILERPKSESTIKLLEAQL